MSESLLCLSGNTRRLSYSLLRAVGFAVLAVLGNTAAASESGALDVLKATTEELSSQVEQNREAIESDPDVAHDVVRRILKPRLDLERTSRWVLGKHWGSADDNQKQRFIAEFTTLLVRTYATAVADLAGVEVEYLPLKGEPGAKDVTVQTQIAHDGGEPIGVYYRMYNGQNGWKVYDVSIDGVSLVTTYRSSFSRVVRSDGIDALINRLVEKNKGAGQTS